MPKPKVSDDFSEPRIMYSAWDIAKLRQITPKGAKKFMAHLGVPEHHIGNKIFYYMTEIRTYAPEMLMSIMEVYQLKENFKEQLLTKEEYFVKLIRKVINEEERNKVSKGK
jgi:hypothetical protein